MPQPYGSYADHRPSTIDHQPSPINHRPSTILPQSMVSGAEGAGEFAEGGGEDADAVAAGLPFDLGEEAIQGIDERRARPGDPTAEDHDLRIDDIDERGDPAGQPVERAQ